LPSPANPTSYDWLIKALLRRFYPELAAWLVGERPESVEEIDAANAVAAARFSDKLLCLRFRDKPAKAPSRRVSIGRRRGHATENDGVPGVHQSILVLESPDLCPFVPLLRGDPKDLFVLSKEKIEKAPESEFSEDVKRDLLSSMAVLATRVIEDQGFLRRCISDVR